LEIILRRIAKQTKRLTGLKEEISLDEGSARSQAKFPAKPKPKWRGRAGGNFWGIELKNMTENLAKIRETLIRNFDEK
jgi:hypothetical protein